MEEEEYIEICKRYNDIKDISNEIDDNIFSVDYLVKLHKKIFKGIYSNEELEIRIEITIQQLKKINILLSDVQETIIGSNFVQLSEIIYNIWEYQIFPDGNTRTLLFYIKILADKYNFTFNYKLKNEDYFIRDLQIAIRACEFKEGKKYEV